MTVSKSLTEFEIMLRDISKKCTNITTVHIGKFKYCAGSHL